MDQKENADQRHDETFLQQLAAEIFDGSRNEVAPIVDWPNDNAWRQTRCKVLQALLHPVDRRECILSGAHNDNRADRIATPIELGNATTHRRTDIHSPKLGDTDWRAGRRRIDNDVFDITDRP